MKDLSNFIKDLDSKSVILGSRFGRQYKSLYIKEKINERFYSLYQQDSRDVFFNDPLKFMAVYDSEKNILFNVEHSFGWGMENQDFDIEISSMTFETIKNEISDKRKTLLDLQLIMNKNSQLKHMKVTEIKKSMCLKV